MSWAEGPVDLTRRIFAIAAGSPADRKAVSTDYEAQNRRDRALSQQNTGNAPARSVRRDDSL